MATSIQYDPNFQVTRDHVCYLTPENSNVQQGFLIKNYVDDEDLHNDRLEALDGSIIENYTLTPCPIVIQTAISNKKVFVLRVRNSNILVFLIQVLNDNGTFTNNYFHLDGSVYIGDITSLEIAGDSLNYSSPTIFCHNGTDTISRTDVWDEARNLVAVIWQNTLGAIIGEPTNGSLVAGSCNLPLDTELILQYDNQLNPNGSPSGRYCPIVNVLVFNSNGTVIYSRVKLKNGVDYVPVGSVSSQPLIPPVVDGLVGITNGEEFVPPDTTQSLAMTIEYANDNNQIEVYSPATDKSEYFKKIRYHISWSVDGNHTSLVAGKIKAYGRARARISYTIRPPLVQIDEGLNPLDAIIPVPAILNA
ncbi:hypothetical protein LC605_24115 [Nostoc sp. CHAB 5836]|uniref:hypothetical protein n=1 Tax=Nostoc sp. CHAB 5836 TaxID=2780404 RepID=UPI001E375914|nr:hypothetical protein [Nostoc sp. CHAB 5836]MCC5618114.1 hypothetical protein [Nostoc sp. CHAB 5836]